MKRAFSLLRVKELNDDLREIEGMATTPTPDRVGDIVDPMGASFADEVPLHLYHDSTLPVGNVKFGRPTRKGIPFKAKIPIVPEPGTVRDRVEEAWHSIKYRLIGAVSIGFRVVREAGEDAMEFLDNGGIKFLRTEILELSLVSIPAQPEAVITGIKSFDDELRTALGSRQHRVVSLSSSAGVTARSKSSTGLEAKEMKITEQLKQFEAKREASAARMLALMEKAGEEGRSLNEEESTEYEDLSSEVKSTDDHLVRLRDAEKLLVAKAKPVTSSNGGGDGEDAATAAARARSPHIVEVPKKLKPGVEFARYAMCLGAAKGNLVMAHEIAKNRFTDTPRIASVLKAAVAAGTTTDATWAAPLLEYVTFAGDFVEFLRPQTILGKFGQGGVPALRNVPFNINIKGQTSGGSGYWVGQGKAKPLTKFDFNSVYLGFTKVANIAVLTEELLRFSSPSAELLVRDALAAALIERIDTDFVDPTKSESANVSPASITYGVSHIESSGNDAGAIRNDIKQIMGVYIANNITPSSAVWIMSATTALSLSLMLNALGQPEFPGVTMNGGTFLGIPVIVSEYVPTPTSGAYVILANAQDIWLADDGQVVISASTEASLQMDDAPSSHNSSTPAATSVVSMFQTDSVAIKAERFINWKKRRAQAVQVLSGVSWGAGT